MLPSETWSNVISCGENVRTPHGITRVWPKPGKEPLSDVDCAVRITIQHEPTIPTAIRALLERHGLFVPTAATGLARRAFIDDFQCLPSQETLVSEHLHETI